MIGRTQPFSGKHKYEINLATKTQKNLKTSVLRQVISEVTYESRMLRWDTSVHSIPVTGSDVRVSALHVDEQEYREVAQYFHMTMPQKKIKNKEGKEKSINTIVKIEKVCNPFLW